MNACEHLVARKLIPPDAHCHQEDLSGGVSSEVTAVTVGDQRFVVKRALDRFLVDDEWLVDPSRALAEARALHLAGRLTPGAAPPVFDVDETTFTIVMERAPEGWRVWKALLLEGEADPNVARRLGELLAAWQMATAEDQLLARRLHNPQSFEQQRVDPYFRTLQDRRPEVAGAVGEVIDRMLSRRHCLSHGDFSPKNVLVDPSRPDHLWVVDWEVAHHGDPAFDAAFLLAHLSLKSVHHPGARDRYQRCAQAFWDTWRPRLPPSLPVEAEHVFALVACLVLARVDGKSPAEYLRPDGREQARTFGDALLSAPPATIDRAWRRIP